MKGSPVRVRASASAQPGRSEQDEDSDRKPLSAARAQPRFWLALIAAAAVFAAPTKAGLPTHPGQTPAKHVGLWLQVARMPQTVVSAKLIPGKVNVVSNVSFNGQQPQIAWADSRWEVEYAWHGVLVTVSAKKQRAPFVVRTASVRHDVVRVFVRLSWR